MKNQESLALINANIYPFAAPGRATAIFARGGIIEAVGNDREILSLCTPQTLVLDIQKKVVLPGFIDTHLHLLATGQSLESVDLKKTTSVNDLIEAGQQALSSRGENGEWMLGFGWGHEWGVGQRLPQRSDLDAISSQTPIIFLRNCVHIAVLNSAALKALGITGDTSFSDGVVDLDASGLPTGIVREGALRFALDGMPPPTRLQLRGYAQKTMAALVKKGVTLAQSDDLSYFESPEDLMAFFQELDDADQMPLSVQQQWRLQSVPAVRDFLKKGGHRHQGKSFASGPLKLMLDGSLGARTAALRADYNDDIGNRGLLLYDRETLEQMLGLASGAKWQVAAHAIGDEPLLQLLDAYEGAKTRGSEVGLRVVHCQIGDDALYQRMADLGVGADIQPLFLASDWEMVMDRLGAERSRSSYAWNTLVKKGVVLGGGSDSPVEDFSVLKAIQVAMTRKDLAGRPEHGWLSSEALGRAEAFWLYTGGAAQLIGQQAVRGTLQPGKSADMAVLMENPFVLPAEEVGSIEVGMTIVSGKVCHIV